MENSQRVLNKLSWTEQKSIKKLFESSQGSELFVVASKVADSLGISKSVIVNAMRKLEGAGVIDSRSLGIKGTYIKIIDPDFLDAVKALEV